MTKVAEIYRRAADTGEPPARAVSEALSIPMPTANAWIRRAKDLGLLDEATRLRNAKAVRVAAALGVSYEALVAAIVEHADGDLRVGKGGRS